MAPPSAPVFSRRGFILFLILAPASFACVFAIILVLQYKQFRSLVASVPDVPEVFSDSVGRDRIRELGLSFQAFASGKTDSLRLTGRDLDFLLAASPVARSQSLRFHVEIGESVLTVHSTQPLHALRGRLAWLFRKMARDTGYLNAVLEGAPKFEEGRLELDPNRGFMNGQRVPRAGLVNRGGMSPGDFLENRELYEKMIGALAQVKITRGKVLMVRQP